MQGRIENKIQIENRIQRMILDYPEYMKRFYYSLNQKTHMTKLRYITNTIRFLSYCSKIGIDVENMEDLRNIDSYIVEQFMESINYIESNGEIKELTSNTKAIIYSSINMFFEFLKANKYILESPFDSKKIQRPKIEIKDVTFLTPEEVKGVENYILKNESNEWRYRDLLLFRIPVINGLRVTALSEINIEDIDYKSNSIKVTEKGNITKSVYVDNKTLEYISKWIRDRDLIMKREGGDSKALFLSNRKSRLSVRSIERIITNYTKKVVPYKHITPHKLRSTCGTNLYQAKKDIYLVAKVLGHKSTAPTQRYTCVFEEDKRDAINVMADLYG